MTFNVETKMKFILAALGLFLANCSGGRILTPDQESEESRAEVLFVVGESYSLFENSTTVDTGITPTPTP